MEHAESYQDCIDYSGERAMAREEARIAQCEEEREEAIEALLASPCFVGDAMGEAQNFRAIVGALMADDFAEVGRLVKAAARAFAEQCIDDVINGDDIHKTPLELVHSWQIIDKDMERRRAAA